MKVTFIISLFLLLTTTGCKLKRQLNEFGNQQAILDSLQEVMQQQRGTGILTHDYQSDTLYATLQAIHPDPQLDTLQLQVDIAEQFINSLKNKLQIESTGEGDMATPTRIMIKEGNAAILKTQLENLEELMSSFSTSDSMEIKLISEVPEHISVSWETYNFDRVPMIAVITILTKLQHDIGRAENDLLIKLLLEK